MSASAGYKVKMEVAPNSGGSAGTYAQLETVNSLDLDETNDKIETTRHGGSGSRTFLQTLQTKGLTAEVFFDGASTPQGTLRSARSGRTTFFAKLYLTPSTGLVGQLWVDSAKFSAAVGDGSKQSFSLTAEDDWTTF